MNRPQPIVSFLRAIYAVIDEQRQALCVALLAANICWGQTCIIGLVQLGAVVDEQRPNLYGTRFVRFVDQLAILAYCLS